MHMHACKNQFSHASVQHVCTCMLVYVCACTCICMGLYLINSFQIAACTSCKYYWPFLWIIHEEPIEEANAWLWQPGKVVTQIVVPDTVMHCQKRRLCLKWKSKWKKMDEFCTEAVLYDLLHVQREATNMWFRPNFLNHTIRMIMKIYNVPNLMHRTTQIYVHIIFSVLISSLWLLKQFILTRKTKLTYGCFFRENWSRAGRSENPWLKKKINIPV